MADEHAHQFKPQAHVDGCHFYGWTYRCDCGETREQWQERDFRRWNPFAMLGYEKEKPCERCLELALAHRGPNKTLQRRLDKLRAAQGEQP